MDVRLFSALPLPLACLMWHCVPHLNAFIGKKSEEYVYRQAQYKFDRIIKKP